MRRLSTPVVGVVGGGLAGALTTVHLLRAAQLPLRVVLVDRSGSAGRGVAYATRDDAHLLNVPMERLSAFSADPDHFARWARATLDPSLAPGAYLPRRRYGDYVEAVLRDAERGAAHAVVERVRDEVVDLERTVPGAGVRLRMRSGARLDCDAVVLALGNLPAPAPPWLIDDPRVAPDPWAPGALDGPPARRTLLVGTGLTAVDAAISFAARDDAAEIVATSGCGRLPFAQLPGRRTVAPPPAVPDGPLPLPELVALVEGHIAEARAQGFDWRDAIDGLRPVIPELWRRLSLADRRCFVADHARAWELRRHRMAPEVAARIAELRAAGRLRLSTGRVVAMRATRREVEVEVVAADGRRIIAVDRVVVCAGPCADVARTPDPLVRRLLAGGWARPDALGLGLCGGPRAELRGDAGVLHDDVRVLGPVLRGQLWETTAVAEIRRQAERLALLLSEQLAQRRPDEAAA
ncbi:MAG TPA: FAD/NAD(P)-binding protein [Capillimicrobium sp.]|nr:FAD/NAD(P)-binding protein [Capillimicrobium sp.]